MRTESCFVQFWCSLLCFGAVLVAKPIHAAQPFLGRALHTNGQVRFTLNGESKAGYILWATTNWSDWAPVVTNQSLASVRTLSFPASDERIFYKTQSLPTSPFAFAVAAKEQVNLNGNNLLCDSYDGEAGEYGATITSPLNSHTNISANGDIIARALTNTVAPGNARIAGHLLVESNGSFAIGPNGVVGALHWVSNGGGGIQPGWLLVDRNYPMLDVAQPWTGEALVPGAGGEYTYVLENANYEISGNFSLGSTQQMLVQGSSALWVKGNLDIAGSVYMDTNSPGCRLKIYCSGTVNLRGNWYKSRDPLDLCIYGLPSCKVIAMATGPKLEAAVYAPQAAIAFMGNTQLFGAVSCHSITLHGNASVHYDESLARRVLRQPE